MRLLVSSVGVLVLGLLVLGASCGGRDLGDPCEVEGAKRCDPGATTSIQLVILCQGGFWIEVDSCIGVEQCFSRDGEALCLDKECDTSNENLCLDPASSVCDGTVRRNCSAPVDCPMWVVEDCADLGLVCEVVDVDQSELGEAMCVAGTGGTGGSGGTAGTGGTAGSGGTAGTGGTAGSGGTAGTGGAAGTGGGSGSCLEVDIFGLPQLAGTLSISPLVGVPDQLMTVTADVDPDTRELTATIFNESSGIPGGSCFVVTGGNETVECDLRVETVADPGTHVLELELRAVASSGPDYTLYTPGDGDTYVRIKVENNVPGPETATSCLVVNAAIEFR